jgi:chromosome partitioning protein
MRKIAVLNQKGGVGKTTTVVNAAAALARMGAKVVVIDLDPQAHLTIHLGLEPQGIVAGSYEVLTKEAQLEGEIMLVRPNLWLLPANINLVGAESELVSVVGRETILREAVASVEDKFDYLIIDCPPSLGLLTLNALAAAEEVLIPLQPHFLALQGFGKLLQTVELVNKRINPDLRVKGILLCMFDTRASLPSEVRADIEHFLESARGTDCAWAHAQILPTFIRRNIKLAEAPSYGQTIFEYERNCHGAEDYMKVAESIHAQYQPVAQVDTQDDIAEVEEGPEEQDLEQTEEIPAVESAQEQDIAVPSDTSEGSDTGVEQEQEKPPIEIKAIPQPDSEAPSSELTQSTPPDPEQNQPEST